jgi:hypothetical protein
MREFLAGNFSMLAALVALALFLGMLLAVEAGLRLGRRYRATHGEKAEGLGTLEGGVLGIMGLLLAFSFSGAGGRFDDRRALIVEEANDIGTAWLRLDLLPDSAQPAIRDSFRSYVDARIEGYRALPDYDAAMAHLARAGALQGVIWNQAVSAVKGGWVPAATLLLPSLNAMFDITTTRTYATRMHPPVPLYILLAGLLLIGSVLAGYGMSGSSTRRWSHVLAFVLIMTITAWITINLEFPRVGFIGVEDFDRAIVEVRNSMK